MKRTVSEKTIRKNHCLFIILFLSGLLSGCDSQQKNYVGIRFSTKNKSNQWNCKFDYLNGGIQGRFTANEDARLIYTGNLEKGSIDFQLFNSKDSLLFTFPANNMTDTVKGIFEKGEQYKIHATAKKARGYFNLKME